MPILKQAERCDSADATDEISATDMDQYRPMYGRSFYDNNRAARLNENPWDQRSFSAAHQSSQQELDRQHEAAQWEDYDRSAGQDRGYYGPAYGQGWQPSTWQRGQERDDRWSAAGSARWQERYDYNHGRSEGRHGFGQQRNAAHGTIYPAPYAQEDYYSSHAFQREPAYHHYERPAPAQAMRQTDQVWYAQYPQHDFYQAAAHQQQPVYSYDYGYDSHGLTHGWQTVNNAPSFATNTAGFTAVNFPGPQQWDMPSVAPMLVEEQYRADAFRRHSQNHHMYHTTAPAYKSPPRQALYQDNEEIPAPPPQAPRLTKNKKKKLQAKQQALSKPPSPVILNATNANWMSGSRASASPKLPRIRVLQRPEPKWSYMQQANGPLLPLGSPRRLLVILDLNGTLLHRKSKGFSFTARPHVNEFLHYLLANHAVMVWSSARPDNVKKMCEKLFTKKQMEQLVAVWARDKLRLEEKHYNQKIQVYKQLSWVWEELAATGGAAWDQSNTILIDDSLEKAASEPHNLVQIEEFENRADQQNTDVLGQVVKYLEVAREYSDVSSFMREYPFNYLPDDAPFDWTDIIVDMH